MHVHVIIHTSSVKWQSTPICRNRSASSAVVAGKNPGIARKSSATSPTSCGGLTCSKLAPSASQFPAASAHASAEASARRLPSATAAAPRRPMLLASRGGGREATAEAGERALSETTRNGTWAELGTDCNCEHHGGGLGNRGNCAASAVVLHWYPWYCSGTALVLHWSYD